MKSWIWLRAASVVLFLLGVGHGIGELHPVPPPPLAAPVLAAMKDVHFQMEGLTRTFWNFYEGSSISSVISVIALAIVIWQLSGLARTQARLLRPIIITLAVGQALTSYVIWTDLIYPPAIFSILATICLLLAAIGT
jgi:hypothetical protein